MQHIREQNNCKFAPVRCDHAAVARQALLTVDSQTGQADTPCALAVGRWPVAAVHNVPMLTAHTAVRSSSRQCVRLARQRPCHTNNRIIARLDAVRTNHLAHS